MAGRRQCARPPCAITFDDGWRDNYDVAFPLLQRYDAPATVFLVTSWIGRDDMLDADRIARMEASGVVFGSHTVTHALLGEVDRPTMQSELADSRAALERYVRRPSRWFCFPKGSHNQEACELARRFYAGAVTVRGGLVDKQDNRFTVKRVGVHNDVAGTASDAGESDYVSALNMAGPIRVLYLRDTTFICGPGKTILNTFRTADRGKVSIALGIPGWTSAPHALIAAAQSIGLPVVPLPDNGRLDIMAGKRLARAITEGEFDLVQTHDFRTRRLATLACAIAHVPHVTSVHGWIVNSRRQRLAKVVDKALIRRARRIIAVSNRLVHDLVESGAPPDRIALCPNAVLLDDYAPAMPAEQARQELGLPSSSKCIGIVGRLSAEKRHDLFLEMAAELASSDPDVRFLIVGHGPLQPDRAASRGPTEDRRSRGVSRSPHRHAPDICSTEPAGAVLRHRRHAQCRARGFCL